MEIDCPAAAPLQIYEQLWDSRNPSDKNKLLADRMTAMDFFINNGITQERLTQAEQLKSIGLQ